MNKRFAAVANLFFSSSQAVFTIITGLVMVPIYLRYFSMSAYGAWLASGNIISMIAIIEPGISTVATQKLAKCHGLNEKTGFAIVFGSALALSLFFSLIVITAGLALAPYIPAWIAAPDDQRRALTLALCFSSIGAGASFVFYMLGAVPQALQRTVVPGIIGIAALSANVITILAGLYSGLGITALGLGACVFSLVYSAGYVIQIGCLWREFKLPKPTVSFTTAAQIWQEAKMLLLAKIAGTIGKYLEAPAAALAVSTEAAAVLVLTGRVLTAVQMFADRVGSAVFAGLSHLSAKARETGDYAVVRDVIVVSTIVSGLGIGFSLALSGPVISVWVGEKAFGGTGLLLLLALSSFVSSRKDLISSLLVALGEIKSASKWLAAEAILRVACISLFAYLFKVPGIPLAGALAAIITLAGLNSVFLRKFFSKRDMLYTPGLKGCAISLCIGLSYMAISPEISNWTQVGAHSLLCGALLAGANILDGEWRAVLLQTISATRSQLVSGKGFL